MVWALKTQKIEGADKTRVVNALLANIDALPIKDAVSIENGQIMLRGKPIESLETAQSLKQGAAAMLSNFTRKIAQEQLLFEASKIGLHQGMTPEQIIFAKAAIWCIQNEERIYRELDQI